MRLFLLCFLALPLLSWSEPYTIKGVIKEKSNANTIPFANVLLYSSEGKILNKVTSDERGEFRLSIDEGTYRLEVLMVGFEKKSISLKVTQNQDIKIEMASSEVKLNEVVIKEQQTRATIKGDTTEFNASAFKVNNRATVGDLVTKMPGFENSSGEVKVQGESIKKVFVDGEEFLGGDATTALSTLPAEIVDKVQVFDRQSEHALLSQIDDGNTEKTLNITTKSKRKTSFGEFEVGVSNNGRYAVNGSVNQVKKNSQLNAYLLSNNVNQTDPSGKEIAGPMGMRRPGGGGLSGITETNAFGITKTDRKDKLNAITYGYSLKRTDNLLQQNTIKDFTTPNTSVGRIETYDDANTKKWAHQGDMKIEFAKDSSNIFKIVPKFTYASSDYTSMGQSTNFDINRGVLLRNTTASSKSSSSYNATLSSLYRHTFAKPKRVFTLSLDAGLGEDKSDNSYKNAILSTGSTLADTSRMSRWTNQMNYKASVKTTYNEPISPSQSLYVSSLLSETIALPKSDSWVLDQSGLLLSNAALTNHFENKNYAAELEPGYKLGTSSLTMNVGLATQYLGFESQRQDVLSPVYSHDYLNILPRVNLRYKFSKSRRLSVKYAMTAQAPSVASLQNLIDNSNPLSVQMGNAHLTQQTGHQFTGRFMGMNEKLTQHYFTFLNVTYNNRYIANGTYVASQDSIIGDGVTLKKGAQLTKPVMTSGYFNMSVHSMYGFPISFLKSNGGMDISYSYSLIPNVMNGVENKAVVSQLGYGGMLGSSSSDKFDFRVMYKATMQWTTRNGQTLNQEQYNIQPNITWSIGNKAKINLGMVYSIIKSQEPTKSVVMLNSSASYYLDKKQLFSLKLSIYDALKQNQSYTQSATDTYLLTSSSNALQRYVMLSLNFRLSAMRQNKFDEKEFREKMKKGELPPPPEGGEGHGGGNPMMGPPQE